jgi:hypothetical protein
MRFEKHGKSEKTPYMQDFIKPTLIPPKKRLG